MINRIGFLRSDEREAIKAEKDNIRYQAEVKGYIDSLYQLLSMQEPQAGRKIMEVFNSILYTDE